jgi:hypothetical protein
MRRWAPKIALLICAACTGSPKPIVQSGPAGADPATPGDEPEGEAELTAAPAPPDLVFVAYLTRPRELQRALGTFAAGNPTLELLAGVDPGQIAARFVGPELASSFDFDRPIYVSASDEEGKQLVVSIGANAEIDDLRARLSPTHTFERLGRGAYALAPRERRSKAVCEVRRAFGAAPVRFVCAADAALVAAHAAYATRTLPRALPRAPVRIETTRRMHERAIDQSAKKRGAADEAYGSGVISMLKEALRDLEGSAFELDLRDDALHVGVEASFSGARSLLSLPIATSPTLPASDAKELWRLPADAGFAFRVSGGDPKQMSSQSRALLERVLALVPDHDLDEIGKRESLEPLRQIFLTGGPLTFAQGIDLERAERTLDAYTRKKATLVQTQRALSPWTLVHLAEPLERWRSALDALDQADDRSDARNKAKGVQKPGAEHERRYQRTTKEVRVTGADRLPKGSVHWVTTYTPNPRYTVSKPGDPPAGIRHTAHVFLVPSDGGVWFGFGDDDAVVKDKLRTVTGTATTPRLDSNAALARLRQGKNIGFGFFTTGLMHGWSLDGDSDEEVHDALESLRKRKEMATLRRAPISFELSGPGREPTSGSPGVARLGVRVPIDILRGLVSTR